jgi:hypothetical protein
MVTAQVKSDPIYGSLGMPEMVGDVLNSEQQLELNLRKMKPRKWTLDEDEHPDT